jgi:hypothetical protein
VTEHLSAVAVLAAWGAAGYVVARARFSWQLHEPESIQSSMRTPEGSPG